VLYPECWYHRKRVEQNKRLATVARKKIKGEQHKKVQKNSPQVVVACFQIPDHVDKYSETKRKVNQRQIRFGLIKDDQVHVGYGENASES
jgi:hypothetical protein